MGKSRKKKKEEVGSETRSRIDESEIEDENDEMGWTQVEGGRIKSVEKANNKRKKDNEGDSVGTDEDSEKEVTSERREEIKMIVRFKEGQGVKGVNPIELTNELRKQLGEIRGARILQDGALLVICDNEEQRDKVMKMKVVCKQVISSCNQTGGKSWLCGVITGVALEVTMIELMRNIKGGNVIEAKRLQRNREGNKEESLSVMLRFESGGVLPSKVMIGYVCFRVREYVRAPMRCYNCQRYGHIASVCRAKKRCAHCGEEHEYGKCGRGVEAKCCNCGGAHNVAYGGCEVRKRAVEIQKERDGNKLSYAEAVKKVDSRKKKESEEKELWKDRTRNEEKESKKSDDTMIVSKKSFVLFMAEVINCSAQTERRTEKIPIIVRAADRFLDIKGLTWEMVRDGLTLEIQPSQESWDGQQS